jgi:NAD+ kinase
MKNKPIKKISFYSRKDNKISKKWQSKIESWLKKKHPEIKITDYNPEAVLVLGGDGTIMEAARKYANSKIIILGINLGYLGFLASINNSDDFPVMLDKFFKGDFDTSAGMIIGAKVIRNKKEVFAAKAFNEIVVQNPLGMVEIDMSIGGEMIEKIRGSGALVATPAGSTAYNLSAHGPIVAPNIECLIVTELFDHDLPTPSLIIPTTQIIKLTIKNFREHKFLKITSSDETVDVVLIADGVTMFVLQRGDEISITRGSSAFKMAVLKSNHFYKSLHSKFGF